MIRSPLHHFRTDRIAFLLALCVLPVATGRAADRPAAPTERREFDVIIYGGTSGGIVAAVQTARMGRSVALVEPGKHLGGLTSGGLGATDIGNKGAIGGISREFYRRLGRYYTNPKVWKQQTREEFIQARKGKVEEAEMWTFEPHVAEQTYRDMLAEAKVPVFFGERLDLKAGVKKEGAKIAAIVMESGLTLKAPMFIDASYEGDLMAKAGVSYHVGREANATYKETLNGVQLGSRYHQFYTRVDPFKVEGDTASGLLPGIQVGGPGEQGQGDHRVQAYNFRMCMTDAPENRVPFPKPTGYDPLRYELLARYLKTGTWDVLGNNQNMPNRKTDTNNNGGFSTDNIGMNYAYPDGDYATRERIFQEHVAYQQGLMWFLSNDPRIPEKVKKEMSRWGLAKDEFVETGHWPHQMYVREARRMISDVVMTQDHCQGRTVATDSVGLAAYGMDSHNVQRYVIDGRVLNEGDVQVHGFTPYSISYKSVVPKQDQCENLLVPVCLSASHIAYGSIRMEPVFMVLGQSTATAAVQAIEQKVPVQKIDLKKLQDKLVADEQILVWTGPKAQVHNYRDPRQMPGIVLDDTAAELTGKWASGRTVDGFIGANYLHDENLDKGQKRVEFKISVPATGRYDLRMAYTALANRATNVPVTLKNGSDTQKFVVNQRVVPPDQGFKSLGIFTFTKDLPATVTISTEGTDGHVIVDAVQLLPVKN